MLNCRSYAFLAFLAPAVAAAQWTYVPSGTTSELRGLSIARDGAIWASGARGAFVRSLDGGRTWTSGIVPGANALDFRALHAASAVSAVVASAGEAERGLARIFATADSGHTWYTRFATLQKGVFLDAIAFWDVRHGIAISDPVDSAFFVLVTSNAGRTWLRVARERLPSVLPGEAAFAASNSCLAVHGSGKAWIGTGGGGRARVFYTPDRGATWRVADAPVHAVGPASGIFAIDFADDRFGIAVGGDYTKPTLASTSVAITRDGGRTWAAASAPPAAYLSGVTFAGSAARVVGVGLAGTYVSADSGQTWTRVDTVAMNAVRFARGTGYTVGPRGRVAYSDSLFR
jgi:photosystem II stability/assembly factor-like uncharacterized protein